jgi:hypothetical protein
MRHQPGGDTRRRHHLDDDGNTPRWTPPRPRWEPVQRLGYSALGVAITAVAILAVVYGVVLGHLLAGPGYCSNCLGMPLGTTAPPAPAGPAARLGFAREMLAGVALPPGSRPVSLSALRGQPPDRWGQVPATDMGRAWQVPRPAAEVMDFFTGYVTQDGSQFVAGHYPRGTLPYGPNQGVPQRLGGVPVTTLYFYSSDLAAGVSDAMIAISVRATGPASTVIRVDAQVDPVQAPS